MEPSSYIKKGRWKSMSKVKAVALGLGITLVLALVIIFIGGQGNEGPTLYEGPSLNTTRVTVQPEDTVEELSETLPKATVAELIEHSDTIVIGTVTNILPARRCRVRWTSIIYTDVIVEVDRYLYGEPESERVGIQAWGGRIGNEVMIVENEAVFNIDEDVVIFLFRIPYDATPPYGINELSYYTVCGTCLGKFAYQAEGLVNNGWLEDFPGQVMSISALEIRIAETKGRGW